LRAANFSTGAAGAGSLPAVLPIGFSRYILPPSIEQYFNFVDGEL
jgi:hypothetical protein